MARLFVVDDDPMILKSLVRLLRRPGFEVVPFDCAEAVLARLAEGPDLLVCDYHLPGADGIAIAAEAKRHCPRTRTLLLTGGVEDEAALAAQQQRIVDRFAAKPWRHDELLAVVDELLAS